MLKLKTFTLACLLLGCSTRTTNVNPTTVVTPNDKRTTRQEAKIFLQFAFVHMKMEQWGKAAKFFEKAAKTKTLTPEGVLVSSWHLGLCYHQNKMPNEAAEAYFLFITHSQYFLQPMNPELMLREDFIKDFELHDKIDYAENYIDIFWEAQKIP